MSEIQQLLREIQAFMSGTNQSYQPRVKVMYERYREQCVELAGHLASCRDMLSKGLGADARSANLRMSPTLVERFDMLNIPERQSFITLCEDYGLPAMPPWDEDIVTWLKSPVQEGDVLSASLMQQWRRIARKGSCAEKIRVLRQIIAVTGVNGGGWKKNLAEVEKQRYGEIEAALSEVAGAPDELARLEEFSLELYSPQLLTHPKEELLEALREQIVPLQRAENARLLEAILVEMQECYERQDFVGLHACCDRWNGNASNPLAAPTTEQLQTVRDVMEFLADHDRKEESEQKYQRLLEEVTEMLERGMPYEQLQLKYGELRRTEHPLPENLRAQMEALEDDHQLMEHRRHVRRCVHGIAMALLLLALVCIAIVLLQKRNQRHNAMADMARMLKDGEFEEGIALYQKLQESAPELARNPELVALDEELKQAMTERDNRLKSTQIEFEQLKKTLDGLMAEKLLESTELDKLLARGEKLKNDLTDEQKKQLVELNGKISHAKEQIRKNREAVMGEACQELETRVRALQTKITEDHHGGQVEVYRAELKTLREQIERTLAESKVALELKNRRRDLLNKELDAVSAAIDVDRVHQDFVQRLEHPSSFNAYQEVLGEFPKMPTELQQRYSDAHKRLGQWAAEVEDAQNTGDFRVDSPAADAKLQEAGERTVFLAEYNLARRQGGTQSLTAWAKAASAKYDLYEMRFVDAQDNSVYFYSVQKPEFEWSKRYSGHFYSIIAEVEPEKAGKKQLAIFKYNRKTKSFVNSLNDVRKSWKTPAVFARLEGWSEESPEISKSAILPLLEPMMKATNYAALEMAAVKLLQQMTTADINPAIKYDVVCALGKDLMKTDEYSKMVMAPVVANIEAIKLKGSWNDPCVSVDNRGELVELSQQLSHIDWEELCRKWVFQRSFAEAFHAHRLCPVGVMTIKDNAIRIGYFVGNPSRELLVLEDGVLRKLSASAEAGAVVPQDNGLAFNGQLVWGYTDSQSCSEFLEYWRKRADTLHATLKFSTKLCPKELGHYLN